MKKLLPIILLCIGMQTNAQLWTIQLDTDPTNIATGLAGVAWSGTEFWCSEWNSAIIHTADASGTSTGNFTIPGVTGTRSITTDGTFMYIGANTTAIYQVDPVTRTLVSTINTTVTNCRYLTYDPTLNNGAGGFWTGAYGSDITAVSMTGQTLSTISAATHGLSSIYGMAFDGFSTGGPFLWAFDQGGNGADIYQLTTTGSQTGVFHDVTTDLAGSAGGGTAGGLFICNNFIQGTNSMIGLDQGNSLFSYELADPPNDDPLLFSLDITEYSLSPSQVAIKGTIKNGGLNTVQNIDLKWSDGTNTYTDNLTNLNLSTNGTYNFTHNDQFNLTNTATNNITVWIEYPGDQNINNNTLNTDIIGVSSIPTKRVVFEEATGTWCGWCPRGAVALETLEYSYPNSAIGIAVHNGSSDPMVVPAYDNGMGTLISGYPSGLIDRASGDVDPGDFVSLYGQYLNKISPVDISAMASFDPTSRNITIDLTATFVTNLSGDYRFNAVILEDGVGPHPQANYYGIGGPGNSTTMISPPAGSNASFNWNSAPSTATVMFDHVARAILGGFEGTPSSIPGTVTSGTAYTKTYNHILPSNQNENNVHVVGMVINNTTGEILNAIKVGFDTPSNINEEIENSIQLFPNPVQEKLIIKGEYNSLKIFDIYGKLVLKSDYSKTINVENLSNGSYIVKIDNETIKKITITK